MGMLNPRSLTSMRMNVPQVLLKGGTPVNGHNDQLEQRGAVGPRGLGKCEEYMNTSCSRMHGNLPGCEGDY